MRSPLLLFALALAAVASAQTPAPDLAVNPAAKTAALNRALPTIFIAGDSTAARGQGALQQGWGVPFADYFDPAKVNFANHARGGRSSRTYLTEGWWDKLLANVKAGDWVLIQLGVNDGGAINEEPPGSTAPLRARGSLPGLGDESQDIINAVTRQPETVHTYGWYMGKMIADTKARGATPIVLSPTVRNIWANGKVERGIGRYREWGRELAQRAGVPFVDVTRLIADAYQQRGEAAVKAMFPQDHTHSNAAGAELNASLVVAGLKGLRKGPFGALLSAKGEAVEADPIGWLNLPEPADPKLPSIFLIGDSTVRNGRGDGEGGQWGWGDALPDHFDPAKVNIVNRAIGGLTGRTFLTQGHWERVLMLLRPGDVVVMQFGTNDNGPINDNSRARGSLPGVGEETQAIDNLLTGKHEVVHTNGWYLRKFVRDTRAAGATPVICSLVPRKIWKEGRIARSVGGSALWARQVAEQEHAAFIDLNELVAARYDALGEEAVNALFADAHTHTSRAGAELNAGIVLTSLKAIPGTPFGEWTRK